MVERKLTHRMENDTNKNDTKESDTYRNSRKENDINQNDTKEDVICHLELLLQFVSQPQVVSPVRIHHILKPFTSHIYVSLINYCILQICHRWVKLKATEESDTFK